MAVVVKKDEKVRAVFERMDDSVNELNFKVLFKEMYPKDWGNIQRTYIKEERSAKPGKGHPMPEPETYLSNMYKVYAKKFQSGQL